MKARPPSPRLKPRSLPSRTHFKTFDGDTAALAAVSPSKVLKWVRDGKLRGFNLGDGGRAFIKVPKQDLVELLRQRQVQAVVTARKERGRRFEGRYARQ